MRTIADSITQLVVSNGVSAYSSVPAALIRLALGTLVTEERASLVFLQAVRSLLASSRAVLHDLGAGTPDITPSTGADWRLGPYRYLPDDADHL